MQPSTFATLSAHLSAAPSQDPSKIAKAERSSLVSRNVTIGQHRTSIRLEPDMWNGLREICRREHVTMHDIATVVSVRKAANTSLTAAIRVFVMAYFRNAATEEGHSRAGHGPGGAFMESLMRRKTNEQDNMGLSVSPLRTTKFITR